MGRRQTGAERERLIPRTNVPWMVLSVGEAPYSLLVQYFWGGGFLNQPEISIGESLAQIELAVSLRDLTKDSDTEGILTFAASSRIEVRLERPVAGRHIVGPMSVMSDGAHGGAVYRSVEHGEAELWVVPRVEGLALDDAEWILRAQGFAPSVRGCGDRVVAQDPPPETIPPAQSGRFHGHVAIIAGP